MNDSEDDDSYVQGLMERVRLRRAKLAQLETKPGSQDVSYPQLSPLREEDDSSVANTSSSTMFQQEESIDDRSENISPDESNHHDYSSDLSIQLDPDVYRAEPVLCNSSPEEIQLRQNARMSPTKKSTTNYQTLPHAEPTAPLQERQPEQKASSSQSLPEVSNTEQSIKNFQAKVDRAEQTRTQLKKLVEQTKYGSGEHVEAARLLQIAEIEHLSLANSMAMYKQGMRKRTESLGSITITGIRLKISSKLRNDLADEGVSHFFFCVASCGTQVKPTEMIDTGAIRRQDLKGHILFKEKINFVDLPPDFVLKVEVFELVIGQHLPKLFSRLTPSKKTKITPDTNFKRIGSLKLTLADREVSYKNLVQWSKHEESKYIERECKFQMELRPEQLPSKSGMLHVRCLDNEGRPDWTRYWVDSSNGLIKFWKSEQDALDGKKPNQIIEFQDLCCDHVQKLTPCDDLYRQNSFVVYAYQQVTGGERDNLLQRIMKDDPKFKLAKHQLAAETKEDRDHWCAILDRSMHCFREWHGKTKVLFKDEIEDIFTDLY